MHDYIIQVKKYILNHSNFACRIHPSIHPYIYLSIFLSFLPSFFLSFYLYIMTLVFARLTHFDPTLVDQRFNGCWWITAWKSWTVRDFCHSRLTAALKARNLWLVPRRLACLKNTSTAAEIWMECKTKGFSCFFSCFFPIQTTYSRMILGSE
jgi:hypothetical protein